MKIEGQKIKAVLIECQQSKIAWYSWEHFYFDIRKIKKSVITAVPYEYLKDFIYYPTMTLESSIHMEKKQPMLMRKSAKVVLLKSIRMRRMKPLVIFGEKQPLLELRKVLDASGVVYMCYEYEPEPYLTSYMDLVYQDSEESDYYLRPVVRLN